MTTPPSPPTKASVLEAIARLLAAPRQTAAYAHYPTLRVQTRNLRDALGVAIATTGAMVDDWRAVLKDDARVAPDFAMLDTARHAYRTIAPALMDNVHRTAAFLQNECRPAGTVDVEHAGETAPSYSDFVRLGAAARAFLDALVQTAYQLVTFDGLQLNYKFLQSLLSFASVAPPALHANIVSPEVQAALDAYAVLSAKDRKNSSFTKAAHDQFPQRLDKAADAVALPDWRRNNLKLVFSFCSDFVHSGYISILALEEPAGNVILGMAGDAFVARAENFAEIKQRLLDTCAGAYADLLLPVLVQAMAQTLVGGAPAEWSTALDAQRVAIGEVRDTLGRGLVEPVRGSLLTNGEAVRIACQCGGKVDLVPPYDAWGRFCGECGRRFELVELPDEVDYVISDLGAGDVLGSDAPKIGTLEPALRAKLDRLAVRHKPVRESEELQFVGVTDLIRCDEVTLEVASRITAAPAPGVTTNVRAFVAAKSLERCAVVRITCNCGQDVDYAVATGTLICNCGRCGQRIGVVGVSGLGTRVASTGGNTFPVQSRDRFRIPGVATDEP